MIDSATSRTPFGVLLHPDRDGILTSAILTRHLGHAAFYRMANPDKLASSLRGARKGAVTSEDRLPPHLYVIDIAPGNVNELVSEMTTWNLTGTKFTFLDHHKWPHGSFAALRPYLSAEQPEMSEGKETDGAAGNTCLQYLGISQDKDEHTARLWKMLYHPREMENDYFCMKWYPILDSARCECRPKRLGYEALGKIIILLSEGADRPAWLDQAAEKQCRIDMQSIDFAEETQFPRARNAHGLDYITVDLQSEKSMNSYLVSLEIQKRYQDAHFCLIFLPEKVQLCRLQEGEKLRLNMQVSVTLPVGAANFRGHLKIASHTGKLTCNPATAHAIAEAIHGPL